MRKFLPALLLIFGVGCEPYEPPKSPVLIVKGTVVSCWEDRGTLDIFTSNNELKHFKVGDGMPGCGAFKNGGIWEIHYHVPQDVAWDGYVAIDWIRKLK